jgi:hypothetical protein
MVWDFFVTWQRAASEGARAREQAERRGESTRQLQAELTKEKQVVAEVRPPQPTDGRTAPRLTAASSAARQLAASGAAKDDLVRVLRADVARLTEAAAELRAQLGEEQRQRASLRDTLRARDADAARMQEERAQVTASLSEVRPPPRLRMSGRADACLCSKCSCCVRRVCTGISKKRSGSGSLQSSIARGAPSSLLLSRPASFEALL